MNTTFVLDAWAILALLQKEEPAASRVLQLLQEANRQVLKLYISIINLGEVYYRIGRVKGKKEADETLKSLYQLPITILPATDQVVLEAASLKMKLGIKDTGDQWLQICDHLGFLLVVQLKQKILRKTPSIPLDLFIQSVCHYLIKFPRSESNITLYSRTNKILLSMISEVYPA